MRTIFTLVIALSLGGCRGKKSSDAPPEPARNPYGNVMPAKVGKQVEEIDRQREEKSDKLLENAK